LTDKKPKAGKRIAKKDHYWKFISASYKQATQPTSNGTVFTIFQQQLHVSVTQQQSCVPESFIHWLLHLFMRRKQKLFDSIQKPTKNEEIICEIHK